MLWILKFDVNKNVVENNGSSLSSVCHARYQDIVSMPNWDIKTVKKSQILVISLKHWKRLQISLNLRAWKVVDIVLRNKIEQVQQLFTRTAK